MHHLDNEPVVVEAVCPICKGAGILYARREDGSVDYGSVIGCECKREERERERRKFLLKYCELPFGSEKLTFDTFDLDKRWPSLAEAKKVALELAEETTDIRWLTLMGEVDCGKTHLAIAICRKWLERSKPARYVLVPLMFEELRSGYNKEGEQSYDTKLQLLMRVDLLVLDDLGAQVPTPWAMEKLMMIIDHRSVNGLPLVVTTNKKLTQLPGDDENRIGSRLMRFPASKRITIEAPEYRTWRQTNE